MELEWNAIRAQGAGGQNVNKVSSALHLRFNIQKSSLPEAVRERLLKQQDQRINSDGIIVIKAQSFRTQEKNRDDALERLGEMIKLAAHTPKKRQATKATRGSKRRRMDKKTQRGATKKLRGRVNWD